MELADTLRGKVKMSMRNNYCCHRPGRVCERILFAAVLVLALDFSRPAFAYLDPGTGSIMLQLLLGGVAGGLVVIRLYWQKLKQFFVRDGEQARVKDNAPGE